MTDFRIIPCEHCGTEGRIYCGHPNDPHPRDCGPCPVCEGERSIVVAVEPIEMEDLDLSAEARIETLSKFNYARAKLIDRLREALTKSSLTPEERVSEAMSLLGSETSSLTGGQGEPL